jgi:hypothetical protein
MLAFNARVEMDNLLRRMHTSISTPGTDYAQ